VERTLARCIAIACAQTRFLRASVREVLRDRGLVLDVHQELRAAGVEAWRLGYDPDRDFRLIKNLAQRRLYALLRAYGFRRHWDPHAKRQGKGFFHAEVFIPTPESPPARIADAVDFLAWAEQTITARLGREAWEEVMRWAKSRQPEPRGKARRAISILREELQ